MSHFEEQYKKFKKFEHEMEALFKEKAPEKYQDWCRLIFDEANTALEIALEEIETLKTSK